MQDYSIIIGDGRGGGGRRERHVFLDLWWRDSIPLPSVRVDGAERTSDDGGGRRP